MTAPAQQFRASNVDLDVVQGFGDEWSRFDQLRLDDAELGTLFDQYFAVFPWDRLHAGAEGFDLGCGSGRWARLVAPRVGRLHCIDASADALAVARRALAGAENIRFHHASVDAIPLADGSMDFGYSLGVLHHVPDTESGIRSAVAKLKKGAPFLIYLYYALDNRSAFYRALWRATVLPRLVISRLPSGLRYASSQAIAAGVYWPLARMARLVELAGVSPHSIPLAAYRDKSFYTMRTDALDRFGTRLEQRFSRTQIEGMMRRSGLRDVVFSESIPYWCAVGVKE